MGCSPAPSAAGNIAQVRELLYEIEIPETLARRLAEELRKRLGHKP
jgi:hypothetical protein